MFRLFDRISAIELYLLVRLCGDGAGWHLMFDYDHSEIVETASGPSRSGYRSVVLGATSTEVIGTKITVHNCTGPVSTSRLVGT